MMGYFDGIGITKKTSTYEIAKFLDINTILVYNPKGEMYSIIPKLRGFIEESKGRIKGIIFSKIKPQIYQMLKTMVEENLSIKVLGFLENYDDLVLPSEKLGLSIDSEKFTSSLDKILDRARETLDLDSIANLFVERNIINDLKDFDYRAKMGIVYDESMNFLYAENKFLFEKYFDVHYISPLRDKSIGDVEFLYIAGGYPEKYLEQLSLNKSLLKEIKDFSERGGLIYSENPIYLSKAMDFFPLVSIFDFETTMTERLQNFGLYYLKPIEDGEIFKEGMKIPVHEFHYSKETKDIEKYFILEKASNGKTRMASYRYKNTYLLYQHINFIGNLELLENIVNFLKEREKCI